MPRHQIQIRRFQPTDDISSITAMLHRAYAPLADQGMRYLASHQDGATTLGRLTARGAEGFIAALNGRIVGTITLCQSSQDSQIAWYARPEVMSFEQFGVEPEFQGSGIGSCLLGTVESRARQLGARELACDTSEHAGDLIALYERRGYRVVGHTDWEVTNYQSVVLSRDLTTTPNPPSPAIAPS